MIKVATVGIAGRRTKPAVATNCIRRWPAVKLAVSRTPRARGRIRRLIDSMTIRIGIRSVGVPSGSKWASV